MKKSLCLFLSAILLLCGCGKIETEPVINDFEVDKYIDEAEYIEEEKNDASDTVLTEPEEELPKEDEEQPEEQPIIIPEITPLAEGERVRIALTFDDGPEKHTERLLDIFANYGGKASFFVIGDQIDKRPDVVRRIVNEGHEIGNHTWSHKKLTKLKTLDEIRNEIVLGRDKIFEVTGVECNIVRPPYGAIDDRVKSVCEELEMPIVTWTVDTLDWKTKDKDAVCAAVLEGVKDGNIILCHDLHQTTVDAMEYIIPKLTECGYELVTVSELLGEMTPGKIHRKQ